MFLKVDITLLCLKNFPRDSSPNISADGMLAAMLLPVG